MSASGARRLVLYGLPLLALVALTARLTAGLLSARDLEGDDGWPNAVDAVLLATATTCVVIALVLGSLSRGLKRSVAAAERLHQPPSAVVLPVAVRVEDIDPMRDAGVELRGLRAPRNLAVVLDGTSASWWAGSPARCLARLDADGAISYRIATYRHVGAPYAGLGLAYTKDGVPRELTLVIMRSDTVVPRTQSHDMLTAAVSRLRALERA